MKHIQSFPGISIGIRQPNLQNTRTFDLNSFGFVHMRVACGGIKADMEDDNTVRITPHTRNLSPFHVLRGLRKSAYIENSCALAVSNMTKTSSIVELTFQHRFEFVIRQFTLQERKQVKREIRRDLP